jgi:glutamine synthetase
MAQGNFSCRRPKTKEDVLKLADEQNIRFILLQFTDILGIVKSVAIPVEQLEKALNGEILFDGSSVHGFVRIEESDMFLKPDPSTYVSFPWFNSGKDNTARLICDIYTAHDEPFEGCPRLTLKRVLAEAKDMGYTVMAGPEAEFFLFNLDDKGRPTLISYDQGSYFDLSPVDKGEEARRDMVIALQEVGFDIEAAHHETAPGQHEIDFRYAEMLETADNLITFKIAVRTIALKHGLHATFMPKPVYGVSGSGMHTNQSLFKDGKNAFDDPSGKYGLSNVCLHYLGGLMNHARGLTAITNPLVNSYKRLVPDYEAPVYIAWSHQNRSPLIRVPVSRGKGTRLELRSPDPSCNPYLAMAVMLKAGLDGISRGSCPPEPVNKNIYQMDAEERKKYGIECLPRSLDEALEELLKDEVIVQCLGNHIVQRFVDAKRIECELYRTRVHQWEIDQYLAVF